MFVLETTKFQVQGSSSTPERSIYTIGISGCIFDRWHNARRPDWNQPLRCWTHFKGAQHAQKLEIGYSGWTLDFSWATPADGIDSETQAQRLLDHRPSHCDSWIPNVHGTWTLRAHSTDHALLQYPRSRRATNYRSWDRSFRISPLASEIP